MTKNITVLSPFLPTDVLVGSITAQLRRIVSGAWTNVGSAVTPVLGDMANGYLAAFTVTVDADGSWDGVVRWSDSAGTPLVVDAELNISPDTPQTTIHVTKLSYYLTVDTVTAPVTAQAKRMVSGSITNVGSSVTAVATGVTNGYGARLALPADANGGWSGVVQFADSNGSPLVLEDEIQRPGTGSIVGSGSNGFGSGFLGF